MKLNKLLILSSSLLIILSSCGTLSEAGKVLRNEKTASTDEFLIKKKEPLTQPPDFDTIPEPGTVKKKTSSNQNSIEKILKVRKNNPSSNQSSSSSTEESILKRIKK